MLSLSIYTFAHARPPNTFAACTRPLARECEHIHRVRIVVCFYVFVIWSSVVHCVQAWWCMEETCDKLSSCLQSHCSTAPVSVPPLLCCTEQPHPAKVSAYGVSSVHGELRLPVDEATRSSRWLEQSSIEVRGGQGDGPIWCWMLWVKGQVSVHVHNGTTRSGRLQIDGCEQLL